MNQPIFELEIVNEIMCTMRKTNVGFYQREISYSHCEISNILENLSYQEKSEEEKERCRIESLPFCNGEHVIPLIKKLRKENIVYASYATQILLHSFYMVYESKTASLEGSFLERLFAWMEQYVEMYEKTEGIHLGKEQLSVIFTYYLQSLLDNFQVEQAKQKEK